MRLGETITLAHRCAALLFASAPQAFVNLALDVMRRRESLPLLISLCDVLSQGVRASNAQRTDLIVILRPLVTFIVEQIHSSSDALLIMNQDRECEVGMLDAGLLETLGAVAEVLLPRSCFCCQFFTFM